ncbi:3-deoxy-7-phosphoheptulonate synthase [Photobacterium ganghwense]|uniref:Phospho-2-dehydro-3-deoxyheptonate aldolase n=1 Tax=Photobacterium ganghwense TaxID=320778 RepID=A0A0J1H7L3_9GAMM|nr:3-deoxy-7-phosphoheptulonate synthase [Photobacterium ganghwense]KLV07689.1 phospho-2-dehydro-3-deoxyheptonate aldolase [Photobacterium ganghwense]PSU11458.1 3-deoxy-7-phosphoheptulonate synthase [Photobacterium ganghwense]QSV13564.1 3-deoxy-7-phosphoheptulonate synthase [Photobacterium ganghwense]
MAIDPSVIRAHSWQALPTPATLAQDIPCPPALTGHISASRKAIRDVLHGHDDRLLVVIGPCSIHDPKAALDYARQLAAYAEQHQDQLVVVMRAYFEKPRTTVGWKGLLFDPDLDGSYHITKGLYQARELLIQINALGLPTATEFLDNTSFTYLADLMSWGAIGARTTESQPHRQQTSGLPCPVGFKNGTDGNISVAMDAMIASRHPHLYTTVGQDGQLYAVNSTGNPDCHLILRGGKTPNYSEDDIRHALQQLHAKGLMTGVMIDCSHGNSLKQYQRQLLVAEELCRQIGNGNHAIAAIMAESFLVEGRQDIAAEMTYGQSITDACIGWDDTKTLLTMLADAVEQRRQGCPRQLAANEG